MKKTYIKPQTSTVTLNNEHFIAATVSGSQITIVSGTAVSTDYADDDLGLGIETSEGQDVSSLNFGSGNGSVNAVRRNTLWDDDDW